MCTASGAYIKQASRAHNKLWGACCSYAALTFLPVSIFEVAWATRALVASLSRRQACGEGLSPTCHPLSGGKA